MEKLPVCCILLCVLGTAWGGGTRYLSALRRGPWQHQLVEGVHPEAVLVANLNNSIEQHGWSFLKVLDMRRQGDPTTDEEIAYLAGVAEGNLTASLMLMQWKNTMDTYCDSNPDLCSKIEDYIVMNSDYIDNAADSTDPRWYQMHGDLDDLEAAFTTNSSSHSTRVPGSGSCSAIVKILPGNEDLLIGHNTWTSYLNMIRIFKFYDFRYQLSATDTTPIPGHIQIFPSYPGRLYSGDDFYLLSSGLVTMETSIENVNPDLWKYITPNSILENMRSVVANRLATSGAEWSKYFAVDNSGTYNNQWTIVDFKKFSMGENSLQDDLVWVLEQMPNRIVAGDQTDMLRTRSYWSSYNIPYNKDIFTMSGTDTLVKKYGDWFSWDGAPRAKMFARNHTDIKDAQSLINLMRYNDFQHDDLASCDCTPPYSGENGIAARSDLNPASGVYPFSALGHRLHGAIDMKVTSSKLMNDVISCFASSGPTSTQQPPFQWSTSGNANGIPLGHPDKWDFQPVFVQF